MKAAVLTKTGKIEYEEVPEPKVSEGLVKIRVKSAGLCGSDIHRIFSKEPFKHSRTNILGHEFSGQITEIGSKVHEFKIGDRVTGIPFVPCYKCENCRRNLHYLCKNMIAIGKSIQGAFAEYVVVSSKNLVKIPKNLGFNEAALADTVAVGLHAYHLCKNPKRKKIAIYGDGSIGLITAQIFAENNYVTIIGRRIIKKGIKKIDNVNTVLFEDSKLLKPNTFDIVIECVGRKQSETLEESIRVVMPQGTILVLGVFDPDFIGKMSYRTLFFKEARLQGVNSYNIHKENNEFGIALDMIRKKKILFENIITHILPLSKFNKGLALFSNKGKSGAVKIIFKP